MGMGFRRRGERPCRHARLSAERSSDACLGIDAPFMLCLSWMCSLQGLFADDRAYTTAGTVPVAGARKRGDTLARPNYGYEKRQKELAKQKKKSEKMQRKLDKAKAQSETPSDQPASEGEAQSE